MPGSLTSSSFEQLVEELEEIDMLSEVEPVDESEAEEAANRGPSGGNREPTEDSDEPRSEGDEGPLDRYYGLEDVVAHRPPSAHYQEQVRGAARFWGKDTNSRPLTLVLKPTLAIEPQSKETVTRWLATTCTPSTASTWTNHTWHTYDDD